MSARDEAIEVMARAKFESERPGMIWDDLSPDVQTLWGVYVVAPLDALLSPQSEPCEGDGCRDGRVSWGSGEPWVEEGTDPCPSCNGSGRIEKGPIAYLAADLIPILVPNDDGAGGSFTDENGTQRSYSRPQTSRVVGYRLPSESTNGVKDET